MKRITQTVMHAIAEIRLRDLALAQSKVRVEKLAMSGAQETRVKVRVKCQGSNVPNPRALLQKLQTNPILD